MAFDFKLMARRTSRAKRRENWIKKYVQSLDDIDTSNLMFDLENIIMAKASGNPLLAKQLAAMKARWEKNKEPAKAGGSGGGTTFSPGRHFTRLTAAKLIPSDKGLSVMFEFTGCSPDEEVGEKAVRWAGMDTEDKMKYLLQDLIRLGVGIDDFDITELPAKLDELVAAAPAVRVTVKESGEYTNVYIDKLIEETGEEAPAAEAGDETPAEEPAAEESAAEEAAEAPAEEVAEGEGEGTPLEIGEAVQEAGGEGVVGIVVKIDGDDISIRDAKKKVHVLDIVQIERVPTEEPTAEPEATAEAEPEVEALAVADPVRFTKVVAGKKVKATGVVQKIKGEEAFVKNDANGKIEKLALANLEKIVA